MRHAIDPDRTVMAQLWALEMPEHLPHPICMVYRFLGKDGRLLYIGVTVAPGNRWGRHRRTAEWWPLVRYVRVEWHPFVNSALSAEDAAIKAERPDFNVRSVPTELQRNSGSSPTLLRRDSRVVLPRVGVGVGGGGEVGEACMSSHWRDTRPVDNADLTSTTDRHDAWALRAEFSGGL